MEIKKLANAIGWGLLSTAILFAVVISAILLFQVMVVYFGPGLFALFAVWFVIVVVGLTVVFYNGLSK
jgi:hypothetical protein